MTQPKHAVLVSDPLSAQAIANLRSAPDLSVQEVKGLSEEALVPLVRDIDAWVVRGALFDAIAIDRLRKRTEI